MRFRSLICLSLLSLSFLACSNKSDDNSDAVIAEKIKSSTAVGLDSVTDKCLNLEKYFSLLRDFPAETKARKVTTNFNFRATGNNLPKNFYLRLAAGSFQILDTDFHELPDFARVTQKGCDTLTFSEEGHQQVYKITEAKRDTLTFKNDWDGWMTVTWKSPTQVEISTTSVVGDYLCDSNARGKATLVQQITWGPEEIFTESLDGNLISPNFLALVSQATGFQLNSLYTAPITTEEGEGSDEGHASTWADGPIRAQILVGRLKQMQALPVRSELLQCY